MRTTFRNKILTYAKNNPEVMLLTGDLGFSVLEPFSENFPKQFINTGIAEQNMTGVAAGLAMSGKKVFTYSIANFSTLRCLEQVRNDVCYHNLNITIVTVGGGFSYGEQGYTHHGLEDSSILNILPNMKVCIPSDSIETSWAMDIIMNSEGPFYLKLGKNGEKPIHKLVPNGDLGSCIPIIQNGDILILSHGSIINEAITAAEELQKDNIQVAVWSMPWLKPFNKNAIQKALKQFNIIITLEEAQKKGGLGSNVAEIIAEEQNDTKLIMLGVNDVILHAAFSQQEARKKCGIDKNSIIKLIQSQKL